MTDAKLKSYLDRVEEARADYFAALGQISDDARDAGLSPGQIIGEIHHRAWIKERVKDPHGSIYFAKVADLDVLKIGFSINVADRMRALKTEYKREFDVLGTVPGTMSDERWFHRMLVWCQDRTLRGKEFFKYTPIRGLARIFIRSADNFPFNDDQKQQTAVWVNRVREACARGQPTHDAALASIGQFFEQAYTRTCEDKAK